MRATADGVRAFTWVSVSTHCMIRTLRPFIAFLLEDEGFLEDERGSAPYGRAPPS